MKIGSPWPRSIRNFITGGLLLAAATTFDVSAQLAPEVASHPAGLNRRHELEQRNLEYLRSHTDAEGQIRPDLWHKGIEDTKRMRIALSVSLAPSAGPAPSLVQVFGVAWQQIGPA